MAEKYCNGEHVCGIPFATGNVYCRNCGELLESAPMFQSVSYQSIDVPIDVFDRDVDSLKDIR